MDFYNQSMIEEAIFLYLIHNQWKLKELIKPLREQKENLFNQDSEYVRTFKDDINKQYDDLVRKVLIEEISKELTLPVDCVIMTIENLNLESFFV